MDSLHEPPVFQKPQLPTPPPFPTEKGPKQRMRLRVPATFLVPALVILMTAALVGLVQSLSPRHGPVSNDCDGVRVLEGSQAYECGTINGGNFTYEVEFRPQRTDPMATVGVYFLKSDEMNYYELTAARTGEITLYFTERGIRKTLPLSGLQALPSFDNGINFRIVRSFGDDIQVYIGGNIVHYSENPSATWGSFGIEQQGGVVAGYKILLRSE